MFVLPTIILIAVSLQFLVRPLIAYNFPIGLSNLLSNAIATPSEKVQNFIELTNASGYPAEEHEVITEDGYILKVFRLKGPSCSAFKKIPALLVHGIGLSSDSWLDAGPEASLAYLLADNCYDLWIANTRGNYYSRAHIELDADVHPKFWQYSSDELGLYDLPASIDYVLQETRSEQLNYIGYSQGGGSILITLSERPEYNKKIKLNIGLAPAGKTSNIRSSIMRLACNLVYIFQDFLELFGLQELVSKSKGDIIQRLVENYCSDAGNECVTLLDSLDPGSITNSTIRSMFMHIPSGIPIQMVLKYYQAIETGRFSRFDYGVQGNIARYGRQTAPDFDLSKVTVPAVYFTGLSDNIVVTEDVQWTADRLPNFLEVVTISDPNWNHFDMAYSQRIPTLLFPKLNEYLSKYSDMNDL